VARNSDFAQRIGRARVCLKAAKPVTTYEAMDRIPGLQAAGASAGEVLDDARSLLSLQRADGGWAQTPYLASGTGMTLHSLYSAGLPLPSDGAMSVASSFC
jgi:hypothetical protein